MATAEQLLRTKKICESVKVIFPPGILFPPFENVTQGELYRSAPVGTLTIMVKKKVGFEYFFAYGMGDIFAEDKGEAPISDIDFSSDG